MNSIYELPNEIQDYVFSLLQPLDLINLCMTSQQSLNRVEPHLYRDVYWSWNHASPELNRPFHLFLGHLLRRPKLAGYVRSLTLASVGFGSSYEYLKGWLSDAEKELATDFMREIGLSLRDAWARALDNKCIETMLALVILQLHQVQHMTINMFHDGRDHDSFHRPELSQIGHAFTHIVENQNSIRGTKLARLTSIEWPSATYTENILFQRRLEFVDMAPLFYLPNLQAAVLRSSSVDKLWSKGHLWLSDMARSSALTTLHLQNTTLSELMIVEILLSYPNLQTFKLGFCRGIAETTFNATLIERGLRPCCAALRNLTVRYDTYDDTPLAPASGAWSITPFTTLRDFVALQTVEISFPVFPCLTDPSMLSHHLPSTLETLTLYEETLSVLDGSSALVPLLRNLDYLVAHDMAFTPNLRRIEIEPRWFHPIWAKFKRTCEDHNIECVYT